MPKNMLLMHKDSPVIEFNTDEGVYDIIKPELLPYQTQGKFRHMLDFSEIHSRYDLTQQNIAMQRNYNTITDYAASRVLPITRDNAKKIYSLFGYEQRQDQYSKARIAFVCKAVSLQDDYWFKTVTDSSRWENVNIRHNSLSEIVAQVSLAGSSLTLQGEICTPELNGQGAYAKAWKREPDGLYLHKAGVKVDGVNRDYESQIEVTVSGLLDKCNVEHVGYEMSELYGVSTCRCKCLTNDHLSILPGMDFISYCNVNEKDPETEIKKIDEDSIYKMWIVDYLISNRDRHGMNWGFYYDTDSLDIIGCHPLFDHNNAFDSALMKNPDAEYLYDRNMTMRQAAHIAMRKTNFCFTKKIDRDDFMDDAQYQSFMSRAEELGIEYEPDRISDTKRLAEWLLSKQTEFKKTADKVMSFRPELAQEYRRAAEYINEIPVISKKAMDAELKRLGQQKNSTLKELGETYKSEKWKTIGITSNNFTI